MGFPTPAGPVPIVVGAVLFDLMVGDPLVRPTAASGYAACQAAVGAGAQLALGLVGAGTGATVGKWEGPGAARPGGIGSAARRDGQLAVAALVAVNAFGAIRATADRVPGDLHEGPPTGLAFGDVAGPGGLATNTTIGVVATNATLDKVGCLLVAQSGHDGLARALEPAHTTVDGDALVAAAVGGVVAPLDLVRHLAALAVEDAIRLVPPPVSPGLP